MYEEHENIKHFDWKLQAVTTLKWDQNVFWNLWEDWTSVVLSWVFAMKWQQINFLLPSMTALFLDFWNKLYLESDNFFVFKNFNKVNNHYSVNDFDKLIDVLQKRIWNVIYSFLALESFMNESIKEDYIFDNSTKIIKTRKWTKDTLNKKIIENDITTVNKFTFILADIYNISKLDKYILNDFCKIKDLRDKITHLKELDRKSFGVNDDTIWKQLLDINFINYSVLVKNIIWYFYKNLDEKSIPRWFHKNNI